MLRRTRQALALKLAPWLRTLRVPRDDGEICKRCYRPVAETCPTWWTAPDDLWNEVEGGPAGIRCVPCFARDCEEAGVCISWRAVRESLRFGTEVEMLTAWAHTENAKEQAPLVRHLRRSAVDPGVVRRFDA